LLTLALLYYSFALFKTPPPPDETYIRELHIYYLARRLTSQRAHKPGDGSEKCLRELGGTINDYPQKMILTAANLPAASI
jgi:hypothetical protein